MCWEGQALSWRIDYKLGKSMQDFEFRLRHFTQKPSFAL